VTVEPPGPDPALAEPASSSASYTVGVRIETVASEPEFAALAGSWTQPRLWGHRSGTAVRIPRPVVPGHQRRPCVGRRLPAFEASAISLYRAAAKWMAAQYPRDEVEHEVAAHVASLENAY
jgi:hypothetical protein